MRYDVIQSPLIAVSFGDSLDDNSLFVLFFPGRHFRFQKPPSRRSRGSGVQFVEVEHLNDSCSHLRRFELQRGISVICIVHGVERFGNVCLS